MSYTVSFMRRMKKDSKENRKAVRLHRLLTTVSRRQTRRFYSTSSSTPPVILYTGGTFSRLLSVTLCAIRWTGRNHRVDRTRPARSVCSSTSLTGHNRATQRPATDQQSIRLDFTTRYNGPLSNLPFFGNHGRRAQ
jgi:hypothetical protein